MKRRILALFTAVLLVLSALAFVGCDKGGNEGEESKVDIENLSAKELFALSFKNTATGGKPIPDVSSQSDDMKATFDLTVNKLEVAGQDITQGETLSLFLALATDMDNTAAEIGLELQAMGEKPAVEAIVNTEGVYITEMLGLNDKPIAATFADMGIDLEDALASSGMSFDELKSLTELGDDVLNVVKNAIDSNINDSAFTSETKDVTIDGKEIKGAKVITLTVTGEMIKKVIGEVWVKLNEIENETLKSILSEIDADADTLDEITEVLSEIKIVNTVDYDKTVALDIEINGKSDSASSEAEGEAVPAAAESIVINITAVGDNFKLKAYPKNDSENNNIEIAFTVAEDGKANFALSVTDSGETITPIKAEGTYANGKFDGTASLDMDGDAASVKFSLESTASSMNLNITEISIEQYGATTTIPLDLEVGYTVSGSKTSMSLALELTMEDMADIDVELKTSFENTDVTIEAPKNAVSMQDISEEEAMGWLTELQEKYPNIIEFISTMIEDVKTPAQPDYDFGYEEDYTEEGVGNGVYDEDYDYDWDSDFGTGTVVDDDYDWDSDFGTGTVVDDDYDWDSDFGTGTVVDGEYVEDYDPDEDEYPNQDGYDAGEFWG